MKKLALASMFALLAACGGNTPEPAAPAMPSASVQGPVVPNGDAKVGDRTKCPVSGDEFVVSPTSPKAEYKGKTYYFCCPGCDKEFAKDPEKFLQKQP
jgi:YHS domain-containing protein